MRYTFRPLGLWTEGDTKNRRGRHTFSAPWQSTLDLLARELHHLDARDAVIQADVSEEEIRLDGMLRASARVGHPGVRIAFESRHGPLIYATDSCAFWQHNVRSIALGLEALRAVDRYGVTHRGEQYTGWKQITAGSGNGSRMTQEQARSLLRAVIPNGCVDHQFPDAVAVRKARAFAHPDRHGGARELWDQVEQAARVLGVTP